MKCLRNQKIASILSAYDNLIENNTRRIQILEEMAQRIYKEWFVDFKYPGHEDDGFVDSELGKIPEGWKVKNITELSDISYGFAFKSKGFNNDGIGTPVARIRDVLEGNSNTFTIEEPNNKYRINLTACGFEKISKRI